MFPEILSPEQQALLPLIKSFSKNFYLAGGTAIALHLGHRQSIDFDLFTNKEFDNHIIRKQILKFKPIDHVMVDKKDEYTIVVAGVKITFLLYDFKIEHKNTLDKIITLPNLLTLSAMKAYALGRRAKWKDYVDLFFILKQKHNITQICQKAKKIFGIEFNEKNFRSQLAFYKDIDYSETVDYLPGQSQSNKIIKETLTEISLQI